jgi:hypothetical protein
MKTVLLAQGESLPCCIKGCGRPSAGGPAFLHDEGGGVWRLLPVCGEHLPQLRNLAIREGAKEAYDRQVDNAS